MGQADSMQQVAGMLEAACSGRKCKPSTAQNGVPGSAGASACFNESSRHTPEPSCGRRNLCGPL